MIAYYLILCSVIYVISVVATWHSGDDVELSTLILTALFSVIPFYNIIMLALALDELWPVSWRPWRKKLVLIKGRVKK